MSLTHRERIETAWSFREPDRVPIEIHLSPNVRKHPRGERVFELVKEYADNFRWVPGANFGFAGFPTEYNEEVIEEITGGYKRIKRTHETPAGTFTAITYHPEGSSDYHWEKRFVSTPDELRRLIETPRPKITWDKKAWEKAVTEVGDDGYPIMGLMHPLGWLVRNTTMEEIYAWFRETPQLIHQFLEVTNSQIAETVKGMLLDGLSTVFSTAAHEMFIPPWMGRDLFDEFVIPYDRMVNQVIHKYGGRLRIHCHGRCGQYLETFAELGADSVEPLEHEPAGDVDLADAKRRVGDRMLLSGNIASEHFVRVSPEDVRRQVKEAIKAAASGGGFSLRTSGGNAGTSVDMDDDMLERVLQNCEAYILAALEYGQYPIRL